MKARAPMNRSRPKRLKVCRVCKVEYPPQRIGQKVCSQLCAQALAKAVRVKAERKEVVKQTREAKERLKTRSEWMKDAQKSFNAFIRVRDVEQPCICCGQWGGDETWKPGGQWDAGHFLGVGAYPELRFEPENCHKQLKSCNAGSGKYAHKGRTVAQAYRERLIVKIGLDRVEWIEGPHEPKKYSIDDLKAIRDAYRTKLKDLKKAAAHE